ncbi:hypothetical protein BX265_7716 [Streptomyces sp. TLI_235]|nr:hypothetical protein BX265_7716 [Streptomyces sp. TLI_235]
MRNRRQDPPDTRGPEEEPRRATKPWDEAVGDRAYGDRAAGAQDQADGAHPETGGPRERYDATADADRTARDTLRPGNRGERRGRGPRNG